MSHKLHLYYVEEEWERDGRHPLLLASLPLSLLISSQPSVYVATVAEEDGEEKIMLSGTPGGNG